MANDSPFAEARRSHKRTHDEMESRRFSSYSHSVRDSPPSYRSQRTQTNAGGPSLQLPRPLPRISEAFRSQDDHLSPFSSPADRSHSQSNSRPDTQQQRFPGDGFDFRRTAPAAAAPNQRMNVIDLTSDNETSPEASRGGESSAPRISERRAAGLPRFANEIIVLSDEPAVPAPSRSNYVHDRPNEAATHNAASSSPPPAPSSPEIQFISSRTLSLPRDATRPIPPISLGDNEVLLVTEEDFNFGNDETDDVDDDPIEILSVRRLNPPRTRRVVVPRSITRREQHRQQHLGRGHRPQQPHAPFLGFYNRLINWVQERNDNAAANNNTNDDNNDGIMDDEGFNPFVPYEPEINVNINMDYAAVGFDLPARNQDREDSPTTYEPPPPAPEGFTRTPTEGDVLVCPNCGEELCVGESDLKKQVWIVRGCGHVYCGSCTANRSKSKRKGKMPAQAFSDPFNRCVVEGCGKSCAGRNSMIQLFL